jgi:hypothetical protein
MMENLLFAPTAATMLVTVAPPFVRKVCNFANLAWISRALFGNLSGRSSTLRRHEGHAIAAVPATSKAIADRALSLIQVDCEVLPRVIDR